MKNYHTLDTPMAAAMKATIAARAAAFAAPVKVPSLSRIICPLSQLSERVRQRVATK
ncbi:hypothetical protein [Hymenobacter psychrophilus]|uniref:Uncharacterized protein n=1 Tax=Hymenobacter psychrophilus TaxID=651662 RepID=A0A1H3PDU8_9BACT|nr:hypothetical protein [Hymenobacter psychrophilus]SDY99250.1 hypothetical protein SAMN04488069_12913 [Hymenobacter psychrophilus]